MSLLASAADFFVVQIINACTCPICKSQAGFDDEAGTGASGGEDGRDDGEDEDGEDDTACSDPYLCEKSEWPYRALWSVQPH